MSWPTQRAFTPTLPMTLVVTLVPVAAAIDVVGGYLNGLLKLPTFLDMIGTCVAAIVLGPWWGALAGAISNVAGSLIYGPSNIPFAIVNIAGALVWGYGVRSWGMGSTAARYFVLNIVVALVVTVTAAPIVLFVYGGSTGHSSDAITAVFAQAGQAMVTAVLASNIIVSLADKIISGYVGLAIIRALPDDLTADLRLPARERMRVLVIATFGTVVGVAVVLVYVLVLGQGAPA
jgi:energy-coupling factor transport system substrate-specific component